MKGWKRKAPRTQHFSKLSSFPQRPESETREPRDTGRPSPRHCLLCPRLASAPSFPAQGTPSCSFCLGCFSPRSPVEAAPSGPDQAPSSQRALPLGTEALLSSSFIPTFRMVLWVLPSSDPPHSTASAGHPSSVHSAHLCSRGPTPWSPGPRLYSSPLHPHTPESRTPASAI